MIKSKANLSLKPQEFKRDVRNVRKKQVEIGIKMTPKSLTNCCFPLEMDTKEGVE